MIIEVSKSQSLKVINEFINEELNTQEYHNLLVKLIRQYSKFQGSDMRELWKVCAKEASRTSEA